MVSFPNKLFFIAVLSVLLFFPATAVAQTAGISVGTTSGGAGTSVDLPVSFTAGGTGVSTLQFDLTLPSSLSYVSVTTGSAAATAGKSASGNAIAGGARVVIFGLNQNTIGSGSIAIVRLGIASGTAPATLSVGITGISASSPAGVAVATQGVGGSVTVSAPALPTVTISATDPNASETGPDAGTFTVSRTGSISGALTVNYTVGGTASSGSDYNSWLDRSRSQAARLQPRSQWHRSMTQPVESSETVIVTLSSNASYALGSPSSATVTIADNDTLPTVTISATDPNASETGPDTGTFTVSRTGSTSAALTVNYTVGGTASSGSDYSSLAGSVTIPVGSASAAITVTPVEDTAVESSETVIVTLSSNASYTVGSPNSATVTIADNDTLPTVTISATDPNASETGPDTGTFTVSRTGSTSAALTVNYTVGGTASSGSDYSSLAGSVTIPSGSASAAITVTPVEDTTVESSETVIVTLSSNASYTVGSPGSATVTIADNDTLPTVTISATDPNASETGPDTGTFTVSRTGSTSAALTVNYTVGGTASSGSDYSSLAGSVTIPSGSASAAITVTPIEDTTVESSETVIVTLSSNASYTVGSPSSATVTIADDNTLPTVTISATDPNASETGTGYGDIHRITHRQHQRGSDSELCGERDSKQRQRL